MEAKEIYKKLSQPPKTALREITAGDLKGKTDINPQWRYEAMTETFGLVGIGWKYEIQKLWTEPGARNETLAFAQVAVYIRDPETKNWSEPIIGIGGSKLINSFSSGLKSNDEGYKMAVTDAFSTSLKMIGVAADIYAGRWDGSKYNETPSEQANNSNKWAKEPAANKETPALAGGPDTPEQKKRINEILATKKPDGSKVFSAEDCAMVTRWRAERTAEEVIQNLKEMLKERTEAFQEDIPYEPTEEDKKNLNIIF